jgi:hypothetical protein
VVAVVARGQRDIASGDAQIERGQGRLYTRWAPLRGGLPESGNGGRRIAGRRGGDGHQKKRSHRPDARCRRILVSEGARTRWLP